MVLVVTFFAGTCDSCEQTMADAGSLYTDNRDLVMVGVALDGSLEGARGMVARHELKFPVLFDPDRRVAQRLDVTGPKTGLAVDRRGILRWKGDPSAPGVMRDAAEALLAESA